MAETKQKLTLTVDADTVLAAKKLGLNISEITERVLRGYTYDPDRAGEGASRVEYQELLATMKPLLEKYHAQLIVGELHANYYDPEGMEPVFYDGTGRFYTEEDVSDENGKDAIFASEISLELVDFLRPTEILKNFFTAIEAAKNRRREEVESLVLAKRLVEALNEQETQRATAGQVTKAKGGRPK